MNSKFKIEKDHLIQYFSHKKITYERIDPPKKDPPDLIVRINDLKIGVEHRIIKNPFYASREAFLDKIINECQSKLASRCNNKQISVDCELSKYLNLKKSEINKLTDSLVNLVLDALTNRTEEIHGIPIAEENLPQGVKKLCIYPYPKVQKLKSTKWTRYKSWIRGPLKKNELVSIIEEKHNKVSSIVGNYNKLWLFLVITGEKSSDFAEIEPVEFYYNPNWNFDKIILMHLSEKISWEKENPKPNRVASQ